MNTKKQKIFLSLFALFLLIFCPMSTNETLASTAGSATEQRDGNGQEMSGGKSRQNWGTTAILSTTTTQEGNTTVTRTTYKNGDKKITSGLFETKESELGFPIKSLCAIVPDAYRNIIHGYRIRSKAS